MASLANGLPVRDDELHTRDEEGVPLPIECSDPDCEWQPLENLIELLKSPLTLTLGFQPHPGAFMFMGETPEGYLMFKHSDTRRYMRLDRSGHAYDKEMRPYPSPLTAFEECYR